MNEFDCTAQEEEIVSHPLEHSWQLLKFMPRSKKRRATRRAMIEKLIRTLIPQKRTPVPAR